MLKTLVLFLALQFLWTFKWPWFPADAHLSVGLVNRWTAVAAPSLDLEQMTIVSSRNGLPSQLRIMRRSGRYYVQDGPSERIVPDPLIDALLVAVREPPLRKVDLSNVGITQSWLDTETERAAQQHFVRPLRERSKESKELFVASFRDIGFVDRVVRKYFNSSWTDDYPALTVSIVRAGQNRIMVSSRAQHQFMIPWKVAQGGRTVTTYNANISRAITALLPESFVNKDRLTGKDQSAAVAHYVEFLREEDFDRLDAEDKIGMDIGAVKARYELKTSSIRRLSGVDLEGEWGWDATLARSDLPRNLVIGLHVPMREGKLGSLEPFLTKGDHYVSLVLSIPWFRRYIQDNPGSRVELRFVEDRSVSRTAERHLLEEMRNLGKHALADQIAKQLGESSFVGIDEGSDPKGRSQYSRWLAFPDKRMLLWHFYGRKVLKWTVQDFRTWERYGARGAYVLVSPDGKVQKEP